jgi:hypothetical protein
VLAFIANELRAWDARTGAPSRPPLPQSRARLGKGDPRPKNSGEPVRP